MATLAQLLTEGEKHRLQNKIDFDIEVKDLTVKQLNDIGLFIVEENIHPCIVAARAASILINRAFERNIPVFQ